MDWGGYFESVFGSSQFLSVRIKIWVYEIDEWIGSDSNFWGYWNFENERVNLGVIDYYKVGFEE